MKTCPFAVRALTLSFFFGMIGSFLLYRTGYLTSFFSNNQSPAHTSPNGGPFLPVNDTLIPPKKQDIKRPARMSSSKSLILTNDLELPVGKTDTGEVKRLIQKFEEEQKARREQDSLRRTKFYFAGSKSAIVFSPDSFKLDSLKASFFKQHRLIPQKQKTKSRQQ